MYLRRQNIARIHELTISPRKEIMYKNGSKINSKVFNKGREKKMIAARSSEIGKDMKTAEKNRNKSWRIKSSKKTKKKAGRILLRIK